MEYTSRASTRPRGPGIETTDAANCEGALSACRHSRRVSVAARGLLVEMCAPVHEVTWERAKSQAPGRRPCLRLCVCCSSLCDVMRMLSVTLALVTKYIIRSECSFFHSSTVAAAAAANQKTQKPRKAQASAPFLLSAFHLVLLCVPLPFVLFHPLPFR